MSEACSHDCSSCGSDCAERAVPQNTRNDNNKNIKKVIAVVSGKVELVSHLLLPYLQLSHAGRDLKQQYLMLI